MFLMVMGVEYNLLVFVVSNLCLLAMAFLFQCRCLHADQPPKGMDGFISIDCGASEDTINKNGLSYKSDKDMIESGISKQISPELRSNLTSEYWSLRSFPNGKRNCYVVKPEGESKETSNKKYLIRATFEYGNYDGLNTTPVFDLHLGVNYWITVKEKSGAAEAISEAINNYIEVCLINTGNENGVPYISILELRPFDISLYPRDDLTDHTIPLQIMARWDIGGSIGPLIRYPEDVYDRLWFGLGCDRLFRNKNTVKFVWTNKAISESNDDDPNKVPSVVLQTTCRTNSSKFPLLYAWSILNDIGITGTIRGYFCFYFAEIEKLPSGQFREMGITFNDVHIITPSIKLLKYLTPQTLCSKAYTMPRNQINKLSIFSVNSSSPFPPSLNAIQIFYTIDTTPNSLTFSQDVNAIRDIKQHYKLSRNWQGDPCQPSEFSWDGLNCTNNINDINDNPSFSPRIISLDLSKSNLTGDIATSISFLTAIRNLDLSYNDLEGVIPESLALLPQLRLINLSGNKLRGVVPYALLQKSKDGSLILSVDENPDLCTSLKCYKKWKKYLSLIITSTIIALLLPAFIVLALKIYKRRQRQIRENLKREIEKRLIKLKNREVKYSEILIITDNLKTSIGEGGFGKVYYGSFGDHIKTQVAIKLLSSSSRQGSNEFKAEAQILTIVHHRNLVSLLGYCNEPQNKALIYEFMPNGNLRNHLSDPNKKALNWMERLQIAVDAAQGLEYLHNCCKPPIIHRDMKTSNILLNEKMQAKISDFGLSRLFANENDTHFSTCPAGTFGYVDPTVHLSGNFTKKSDVYSFGVVLFELVSGQAAIIKRDQYHTHIVDWAKPFIEKGNIQNIVDQRLEDTTEICSVGKFVELALCCTLPTTAERPDMSDVVSQLIECLKMLQEKIPQLMPSDKTEDFSYNSIGYESPFSPR